MEAILYALVCVLIPLVWGIAAARLVDRVDAALRKRRRGAAARAEHHPPDRGIIEYYI